ncbi:hypothetical protein RE428_32150 [Marinobacter nanhaiticus D15-8W]|uniref:Uncharacterized protein n=1 Tax=Marinobacter nanhaiticus D15-8W TaxID=626887 RepID=N6X0D4_9GAMM|nr:hypothetical protein [Marinobacter nanhaiticus]ENO16907.1 hypothetical protein J057_01845 [Marinobacter nanhaiticus D15-8W]BES72197.1 hypothetical protein RE428_32150 [Marinobacter nanhaiticus D15-8W]
MTNILGYDIDGRPLRAGDQCVLAGLEECPEFNGLYVIVVGPADCGWFPDDLKVKHFAETLKDHVAPNRLRKLNDDHKPASESFQDIMRKYGSKQGVGA